MALGEPSPSALEDRRALVIGASSGVGEARARRRRCAAFCRAAAAMLKAELKAERPFWMVSAAAVAAGVLHAVPGRKSAWQRELDLAVSDLAESRLPLPRAAGPMQGRTSGPAVPVGQDGIMPSRRASWCVEAVRPHGAILGPSPKRGEERMGRTKTDRAGAAGRVGAEARRPGRGGA